MTYVVHPHVKDTCVRQRTTKSGFVLKSLTKSIVFLTASENRSLNGGFSIESSAEFSFASTALASAALASKAFSLTPFSTSFSTDFCVGGSKKEGNGDGLKNDSSEDQEASFERVFFYDESCKGRKDEGSNCSSSQCISTCRRSILFKVLIYDHW